MKVWGFQQFPETCVMQKLMPLVAAENTMKPDFAAPWLLTTAKRRLKTCKQLLGAQRQAETLSVTE